MAILTVVLILCRCNASMMTMPCDIAFALTEVDRARHMCSGNHAETQEF